MRYWYSGIGRSCNPGRDARHNFNSNAMGNEMGGFLSTTTEQERISTF
jgi:hypothetical protein